MATVTMAMAIMATVTMAMAIMATVTMAMAIMATVTMATLSMATTVTMLQPLWLWRRNGDQRRCWYRATVTIAAT